MSLIQFIGLSFILYGVLFVLLSKTKIFLIIKILITAFLGGYYMNIIQYREKGFAVLKLNLEMSNWLLVFSIFMLIVYIVTMGNIKKFENKRV